MRLLINNALSSTLIRAEYTDDNYADWDCLLNSFYFIKDSLEEFNVFCIVSSSAEKITIKVQEQKCDLVEADMTKVMGYLSEVFIYTATYRHRGPDVEMCLAIE